jgi:hypothetical protein
MRIAAIRRFVLPATIVLILTLASVSVLHAPSAPAHAATTISTQSLCSGTHAQGSAQIAASCLDREAPGPARRPR